MTRNLKLKGTFCHERLTQREFEFISDELEIASVGIEINERNYGVDLCKVSQTGGKYFTIAESSVPTGLKKIADLLPHFPEA